MAASRSSVPAKDKRSILALRRALTRRVAVTVLPAWTVRVAGSLAVTMLWTCRRASHGARTRTLRPSEITNQPNSCPDQAAGAAPSVKSTTMPMPVPNEYLVPPILTDLTMGRGYELAVLG